MVEDFSQTFSTVWKKLHSWEVIVSIFIIYLSFKVFRQTLIRRKLRHRLSEKQQRLKHARKSFKDRVEADSSSLALANLSAAEIKKRLQNKEITPLEALRVYQRKIIDHVDFSGVCDVIQEAEVMANSVSPTLDSPIRGLPISIKENIAVAGYDSSIGLISRVLNPSERDSPLFRVLISSGAIPFVTTTMSPTGFCLDGSTRIFGIQRNPHDSKRLAGGSSSGEAILIAKDASPLGFGTDIAGSLRLPSAFCGISALKPTSYRVSTIGVKSVSKNGCVALCPVLGPMAKHVSLLTDAMRAILTWDMFKLDPRVPTLTFREEVFSSSKPLVIGFYTDFGGDLVVNSVPSVKSGVDRARSILQANGHKLVEFCLPEPNKLFRLVTTSVFADGGVNLREAAEGDPTNPRLRLSLSLLGIPALLRRALAWLVATFFNKSIGETLRFSTGCRTTSELLNLLGEVGDYRMEFAEAWAAAELDILLCPVFPFPAPLDTTPDYLTATGVAFTSTYNLLDYPAGVIPVTEVTEGDVEAALKMEIAYREGGDWLNATHAKLQSGTKGLPICVQVIGKPLNEESVLRVMQEIENGLSS